ncbi:hypothetical protein HHL23_05690 [Chryseobacterium sp. RP-3-3]|uniref:Uncharacterized protein n=1 Tax=Chryseobacterium antibioticum TaxID=2728847 RepID=A0A7Y0FR29_9FLAO|nr:hypothetical protein [Chryseobacterium antibioticum]NML69285.1 hypothetical protein [Chryseobacterium antibioticum]
MDRLDKDTEAAVPETQNQGTTQESDQIKAANSQKMEDKRAENDEKDKVEDGLLLAIHGAKIKFNAHLGEFKVLTDVPTTQGKLTGTIVEKQIPNFKFYDGFQMISLTEWQDFGTAKVQENYVLLKKSTLPGTGKMPGNIPPETGKIEFITSGQVNEPESVDAKGAPVPETQSDIEYIYYTKGGYYLGGLEKSVKVYLSNQEEYDKAKKDKKWSLINKESGLLKEKEKNILHQKFVEKASTIYGESSAYRSNIGIEEELELEMLAIASVHKINKVAYGISSKQAILFRNTKIGKRNNTKMQLALSAIIRSLTTNEDPSNGATMWDGAEQAAFSIEDDRFSTGKFEIHMNTMGWSISAAHHSAWKKGVERLGASFEAPEEKYTPGKNPNNKYSTMNTIALESRAVYLGTIFWKELKTRKKKPNEKK